MLLTYFFLNAPIIVFAKGNIDYTGVPFVLSNYFLLPILISSRACGGGDFLPLELYNDIKKDDSTKK